MALSDYKRAYESAQAELDDLLSKQGDLEKRIVVVRKSIQTLASLCESEGVNVDPSETAAYLLHKSSLGDEIRSIVLASSPNCLRPGQVKDELERLGHDLSTYQNPQATIHMVLKRMSESDNEEIEEVETGDGKKAYRRKAPGLPKFMRLGATLRTLQNEQKPPHKPRKSVFNSVNRANRLLPDNE